MTHSAAEGAAIVADPDGHFPYKKDAAIEGHYDELYDRWYKVPVDEAEAAADYVAAQEAALTSPSDETRAEVERTAQALQLVRARRRGGQSAVDQLAASDSSGGPRPETLIVKGA